MQLTEQLLSRLYSLVERHEELSQLLVQPEILNDQNKFRDLSKEFAKLGPVVVDIQAYQQAATQLTDTRAMLQDESDEELKSLAKSEIQQLEQQQEQLSERLFTYLLPKDLYDDANLFLEIRAGTGGDEAAIFAGDLFRMYSRYVDRNRWQLEILSQSLGEHGGFKEVIARVSGDGVYAKLKYESGVHRVQRVPETEAQGRVHTSACTVAVLPEVEEVGDIAINPADLKIDTYRASGAGGQHVNKTDSAIRITHLPTGTVVECQDERSQHKNRARAMSLLKARLLEAEREAQRLQTAETRRLQVGSGDRSERIRTYNFPQNRLTDHRINLTLYQLDHIMEGDLDTVIGPLLSYQQSLLLEDLHRSNG